MTRAIIATSASATAVTLDYNGPSAGGYKSVTISKSPIGKTFSSVSAGGFSMTDTSGLLGDFVAWCLDISAYLGTSGVHNYETTATPFSNSYGIDQSRIQNVFDANFSDDLLTDKDKAAAFQLALWETTYDDDFDLTTGDFQGSASATILGFADSFLTAADGYAGVKRMNLTFLESTDDPHRQNLVTATPVPLPAAGLMLLGALGGMVGLRRRKRDAA